MRSQDGIETAAMKRQPVGSVIFPSMHGRLRSGDVAVRGIELDAETRCVHYHTVLDIVAIRMKCCGEYYACRSCHDVLADHAPEVWPVTERDSRAVRCGACGTELTIAAYLAAEDRCVACGAEFNPHAATIARCTSRSMALERTATSFETRLETLREVPDVLLQTLQPGVPACCNVDGTGSPARDR